MTAIEKGIPFPARPVRPYTGGPWVKMEIGDSFVYESLPDSDVLANAQAAASYNSRKLNRKFKARRSGNGTVLVWRVK